MIWNATSLALFAKASRITSVNHNVYCLNLDIEKLLISYKLSTAILFKRQTSVVEVRISSQKPRQLQGNIEKERQVTYRYFNLKIVQICANRLNYRNMHAFLESVRICSNMHQKHMFSSIVFCFGVYGSSEEVREAHARIRFP